MYDEGFPVSKSLKGFLPIVCIKPVEGMDICHDPLIASVSTCLKNRF